jgi:hypothetical protein
MAEKRAVRTRRHCGHRTTISYSLMDRIMTNVSAQTFAAACGLISLTACSSPSTQDQGASAKHKSVVLSITELTGGAINGTAQCKDKAGRMLMRDECLPSERALTDAVLACGPSIATIDLSWSHTRYVAFPTNWRPDNPSSLEVVRCVQSKVGFAFSAMVSDGPRPDEPPEGDRTAFLSLHSPRP